MKEKGSAFFVVVISIVICIVSIISMVYSYKTARVNDKNHVIYKNLVSQIDFLDGTSFELDGTKKNTVLEKNISVTNTGEDAVYIDIIWKSIDQSAIENSFEYYIEGTSQNKISYPNKKQSYIPLTTNDGILVGELVMPGDTVIYKMSIAPLSTTMDTAYVYATIDVNVRHVGG